jgi:hypothetical protein
VVFFFVLRVALVKVFFAGELDAAAIVGTVIVNNTATASITTANFLNIFILTHLFILSFMPRTAGHKSL